VRSLQHSDQHLMTSNSSVNTVEKRLLTICFVYMYRVGQENRSAFYSDW